MMKSQLNRNKKGPSLFLSYTLLFALTAALVYLPFLQYGKSFVWISGPGDGLYQHYNAFVYLGQWFRTMLDTLVREHRLVVPQWDFAIGMGGDVLQTLSFYGLGDPFNLISVFFQPETAELGYTAAILLRLWCAGLAFCAYCRKMGCGRTGTLGGAIAYCFSGYLLYASVKHASFILGFIWLPLVWLGIERLLRDRRVGGYVLAVWVAAISNFYFFYMIAFMTVLYVLLRGGEFLGWRLGKLALLVLRVGLLSILAVTMAGAILFPSVMAFLTSSRAGGDYKVPLFYTLKEYASYPGALVTSSSPTRWAIIGLSGPVLLGTAVELAARRDARWTRILLGIFLVLVLLPFGGYMLNGFGYVTNRWVFAWVLLGCFLFSKNLDRMRDLTSGQWLRIGLMVAGFSALVILLPQSRQERVLAGLATLLAAYGFAVLLPRMTEVLRGRWNRLWQIGTVGLVICGVLVTAFYRYHPKEVDYLSEFADAGTVSSLLTGGDTAAFDLISDDGFYRLEAGRRGNINRNFPLYQGHSTTTVYWSLVPRYLAEYMANVSAYEQMQDLYKGMESRALLLPFASVKYYTSHVSYPGQIPLGYSEVGRYETGYGEHVLYQTENYLPLGYTYDSYYLQEDYDALTPVERQQVMLQGAVVEAPISTLRPCDPVFTHREAAYTVVGEKNLSFSEGKIKVKKSGALLTLAASLPAGMEAYVYFSGLRFESQPADSLLQGPDKAENVYDRKIAEAKLDSFTPSSSGSLRAAGTDTTYSLVTCYTNGDIYSHNRQDYLLNLFTVQKDRDKVYIKFYETGDYSFDDLRVLIQPLDGLVPALNRLKAQTLENVVMETNRITGTVNLPEEKLLCLSIPYTGGWLAEIDGVPTQVLRANDMYQGILVPAGTHAITLHYRTPYFRLGAACTLGGFLVFALVLILGRKRRKRL